MTTHVCYDYTCIGMQLNNSPLQHCIKPPSLILETRLTCPCVPLSSITRVGRRNVVLVWSGLRKELVLWRLAHRYHTVCNVYMVTHSHHIYAVHTPVVKQISVLYYSAAQNVLHISANMICWTKSWSTQLADQVQAHSMISPLKPASRAEDSWFQSKSFLWKYFIVYSTVLHHCG